MRREDVARQARVSVEAVQPATVDEVREALADQLPAGVLQVATQQPAQYWRVGGHYFLDDPSFGDVVEMTALAYDATLGLHTGQQ